MKKYNKNYLNATSKIYPPHGTNLRYMKSGEYMFKDEYKRTLIKELGDSGYLLFDFLYSRRKYNYFIPTDNQQIADLIGWDKSKVERMKTLLTSSGYLLILKDTAKDKTKFYRVLLGKDIVSHYKLHGTIDDADIVLLEKQLDIHQDKEQLWENILR